MWAEDIVDHLVAAGVGTAGTDLYWGVLPDKPESCGAFRPAPPCVVSRVGFYVLQTSSAWTCAGEHPPT